MIRNLFKRKLVMKGDMLKKFCLEMQKNKIKGELYFMQKTKDRIRLPDNLVIKKIRELRNIPDLRCSLELLKIEVNDTTLFIVYGFTERVGCSAEYSNLDDALELWNKILDYRLRISEWYVDTKKNDEKIESCSIFSQMTGSCWFGHCRKINAFEPALTTT